MTGTMTPLEERLTAALAARADQVVEADLGPAVVPAPGRRIGWMLVVAAGIVAVIGIPYAIVQLTGEDAKPPSPGASSSADPNWPVVAADLYDVDGDGIPDAVRLRQAPENGPVDVEVQLKSGVVRSSLPAGHEYRLESPGNVDGKPGNEVLVGTGTSLIVLDLIDGELVQLTKPPEPPLFHGTDRLGREVIWRTDASGLYSVRSVEPVPDRTQPYPVQLWQWYVSGRALVPTAPKIGCVRADDPLELLPCHAPTPAQFERPELVISDVGESVPSFLLVDGEQATIKLVGPIKTQDAAAMVERGDVVGPGEVRLVVTTASRSWTYDFPDGAVPQLIGTGVRTTAAGGFGILVRRYTPDTEDWMVFGFVDGELVPLATPTRQAEDPYLGFADNNVPAVTRHDVSWIQGGWVYSGVETTTPGRFEVYRWTQSGTDLDPVRIEGIFCFDDVGNGSAC